MSLIIVIPARYNSTRLPGKPLAQIAGKTLLQRVFEIATKAASGLEDVDIVVATDDSRIADHCKELTANWVLTDPNCATGSDRCLAAVNQLSKPYDFIVNFQGDAALTPPDFLTSLLDAYRKDPTVDVVTPVVKISWDELDALRESKLKTPFSGTCAILLNNNDAVWFSKNIIPAIRNEKQLREQSDLSPVYRHIGIYGYRREILDNYVRLPQSFYEQLEGLEQLRILENGYKIKAVLVDYRGRASMSGIDSPEDVVRAETLISKHGELVVFDEVK
jgi:3-deoxy-manno-octulosonate cytidylyltransferase (CMP-KDO synthetase)